MPYASGETPNPNDYVKNNFEQPGTVILVANLSGGEQVSIRWDDGGRDLPLTPAVEFTLISRASKHPPWQSCSRLRPESILPKRLLRLVQ